MSWPCRSFCQTQKGCQPTATRNAQRNHAMDSSSPLSSSSVGSSIISTCCLHQPYAKPTNKAVPAVVVCRWPAPPLNTYFTRNETRNETSPQAETFTSNETKLSKKQNEDQKKTRKRTFGSAPVSSSPVCWSPAPTVPRPVCLSVCLSVCLQLGRRTCGVEYMSRDGTEDGNNKPRMAWHGMAWYSDDCTGTGLAVVRLMICHGGEYINGR